MANVILKNIDKIYDNGFHAVKNVSVDIKNKEFVVLLGPSGCGKTTTLRMIAGLEEISAGDLIIGEKRVNEVPPKDRDIAMVFQNYALYPHMTVFDNMAFGLKLRKTPKAEVLERVNAAAEILKLEPLLDRKPRQLSGGQRQRVALGRAIVRKPKVFLFDEPLSNLDAKLRGHMRAELSALHTKLATTMIYVTHDQIEAMTLGDTIIIMKDGLIQQVGAPMDLYDRPDNMFVAGFIGSPPMNLLEVTVTKKGEKVVIEAPSVKVELDAAQAKQLSDFKEEKAFIGIRPENLIVENSKKPDNYFEGVAEVVENLGAESYIYIPYDANDATLTAEEKEDQSKNFIIVKVARGSSKDIAVKETRCIFFYQGKNTSVSFYNRGIATGSLDELSRDEGFFIIPKQQKRQQNRCLFLFTVLITVS